MKLEERAKVLKRDIPAVFLALKRKDTPLGAKLLAAVTVAYALSPIDLIPDFIPILGYLDDLIILPFLVLLTIRRIPDDIYKECRLEAEDMWKDGKPKRWYYALPIVCVWMLIIGVILKIIF